MFSIQHMQIKRASAQDNLNDVDAALFADDARSTDAGLKYTALPEVALLERGVSTVLGKRRPIECLEPTSPTTPGVTAFARNWAAAARKRQHIATLRLHRQITRAPPTPLLSASRGADAVPPAPPAIDSPSSRHDKSLSPMATRFIELSISA